MPRPRINDLNDAVRTIVREEVARALAPYRVLLDRLSVLTGGARRGPGRPPGSGRKAAGSRRRGRKAPSGKPGRKWAAGARVRYKQGRGTFDAEVVSQDDSGRVMVRRLADGKEVERDPNVLRKA